MKKIKKMLAVILLISILAMMGITSFASNEAISPRLSHTSGANFSFAATPDGGYIDVTYDGYGSLVRADLTVKVEKRFLLFFWNEVDTWSATNYDIEGEFVHTFTLDGSGTYRAKFTLTVTGTNDTVDTIPFEIESSY